MLTGGPSWQVDQGARAIRLLSSPGEESGSSGGGLLRPGRRTPSPERLRPHRVVLLPSLGKHVIDAVGPLGPRTTDGCGVRAGGPHGCNSSPSSGTQRPFHPSRQTSRGNPQSARRVVRRPLPWGRRRRSACATPSSVQTRFPGTPVYERVYFTSAIPAGTRSSSGVMLFIKVALSRPLLVDVRLAVWPVRLQTNRPSTPGRWKCSGQLANTSFHEWLQ